MNIGIDARLLSDKITGINRFLRNVLTFLPDYDHHNKYFLFAYNDLISQKGFYSYQPVKSPVLPRQLSEHLWLNFSLPKLLENNNIEVFFTPYVLVPFKRGFHKNVIVIHDVMTKVCGQYFTTYYKKYMDFIVPQAIERCDAIVTVSESAKGDICKYYNVSSNKIHVMHLWTADKYRPVSLSYNEVEYLKKKYGLPDRFILYVGAIEERKNIFGILQISDILKSKHIDIKIVLVGNIGFGFEKLYMEIKKRNNRVIYIEHVAEEDLASLYNLAEIFLFPSFYEGFGLPPLEAMKCGIPVLAARNSSLLEVVGEGGLMFDAEDYKSFADNIILLLNDKQFYTTMKNKAIKQSKKFKPENEILKLINLFNSLK